MVIIVARPVVVQPRRIIILTGEVLAGVEVIAGGAGGAAALFAVDTVGLDVAHPAAATVGREHHGPKMVGVQIKEVVAVGLVAGNGLAVEEIILYLVAIFKMVVGKGVVGDDAVACFLHSLPVVIVEIALVDGAAVLTLSESVLHIHDERLGRGQTWCYSPRQAQS